MKSIHFKVASSFFLVLLCTFSARGDGPLGTNESDIDTEYLKEYQKGLTLNKHFLMLPDNMSNCPPSMVVNSEEGVASALGPLEGQIIKLIQVSQSVFPSGSFIGHSGEIHFNTNNDGDNQIEATPIWSKTKDALLSFDYWRLIKHFPKILVVTMFLFI